MALAACSRPGTPVCLVTGFLGAGKTTLLNHVLRNRRGLRAAVFVNEFGALDIDSSLIRWQGAIDEARVVTLDNGCICCEVNADLVKQLQRVLRGKAEVDFIIIETSGICDPGPVLTTLERIDGLAFSTHLDSVLAVVDASSFDEKALAPEPAGTLGLRETAKAQVAHSDLVLLNKCDLVGGVDSERTARIEEALLGLARDKARVLRVEHAAVDLALITALPSAAVEREGGAEPLPKRLRLLKDFMSGEHGASGGEHGPSSSLRANAQTFAFVAERPFDPLKFEAWVEAGGPPSSICRAKGLLWMRGVPRYVVFQLAGSRTNPFETLPAAERPCSSRIVFIGEARKLQAGDEAAVTSALNACLC